MIKSQDSITDEVSGNKAPVLRPVPRLVTRKGVAMYGVVEISGHQYRVQPGDLIDVEKLSTEAGQTLKIDKVLFIGGNNVQVGAPTVSGASVTVKVLKHDKGEKLVWMKRRPGKYQKTRGHRQQYTALLVTELADGKGGVAKIDSNSKVAKKYLK